MEQIIVDKTVEAIQLLYHQYIDSKLVQLQKTKKEFVGDLTLVVFPFLQISKKSPEQTATEIGNFLVNSVEDVENYNVVKGFLNLTINSNHWFSVLNKISQDSNFGTFTDSGKVYMVEYASPNTNKPLHLGHLRNIFLGYSVANILKANGHTVYKTQVINDRGIHICKSMLAWQKYGNSETPVSTEMKGDHFVGKYYVEFDKAYKKEINELVEKGMDKETAEKEAPIFKEAQIMLQKWESGDENIVSLWKTMNSWVYEGFDVTYRTMGVDFDEIYYESDTYLLGKNYVEQGLKNKIFYQKEDGSIWCSLKDDKMDDKLLLRADGTSVYITQDIGTAIERYKKHPGLNGLIYTVGNEQNHHFKVLFTLLKKMGYKWAEGCYHLSYGMIELPEGKMKSREGTVVDADDLMYSIIQDAKTSTQERGHVENLSETEKENLYKMIGLSGLKYYLLKVDPKKGMVFDPKESIDLNGNTGPFIQYTYARIQSLLEKGKKLNYIAKISTVQSNEKEINLIKLMNEYPSVIKEAGVNYSPAILCNYIFELVKEFNNFYQTIEILKEENKSKLEFRLALSENVGKIIKSGMNLMGIEMPLKM